ncbi:hypothetical protein LSAT2_020293, partial [Lamellibrachia satsuma]
IWTFSGTSLVQAPLAVMSTTQPVRNYGGGGGGDGRMKPYQCSVCKKSFSTLAGCQLHENLHRGLYRYRCQYCGKGFSATSNLRGHLATHTGHKEHPCPLCDNTFSYRHLLKRHVLKFHPSQSSSLGFDCSC